jgi:hypothetical protein
MTNEPNFIKWSCDVFGSTKQGYVRVHVFVEPESGRLATRVEFSDFLGNPWQDMAQVA